MKLGSIVCFVIDHKYTQERVYQAEQAQHSVCRRCGHKRYRPPSDESSFLGGGAPSG